MNKKPLFVGGALALSLVVLIAVIWHFASPDTANDVDLSADQVVATSGAAPGYVDDQLCAKCHTKEYESYQHTGMAQSFFRPTANRVIEDFEENSFFHEASQRHYEMTETDGDYYFKRYQLDEAGEPINVFQRKVDWILGSGAHCRAYLYQSEHGELFQLPISWYSQEESWGIAPDFDRFDHQGVTKNVRRECMFCHNAYPDVAKGSDAYGQAHVFPKDLPQGIGCQRCHGPGADHITAALNSDAANTLSTIVNPAKLDATFREDVCNSCHLQPSSAIAGVRRFGRTDYSFLPGESLSDYLVQVNVAQQTTEQSDHFEINHHAYRLRQSRCFLESENQLSCIACHDPHQHVAAEQRMSHYQAACAQCHQTDECTIESSEHKQHADFEGIDRQDCVTCHMPARRTQDFVHVTMTDHLIQRPLVGVDLLAALDERQPDLEQVELLDPENAPGSYLADVSRAMAVLRGTEFLSDVAVSELKELLDNHKVDAIEPYLDLAMGQIRNKQFDQALETLNRIPEKDSNQPQIQQWVSLCLISQGKNEEALESLSGVIQSGTALPESYYNAGLVHFAQNEHAEAAESFEKAIKARPNLFMAWFYLGKSYTELKQLDRAVDCLQRTLEIEPSHQRAYVALREAYDQSGNTNDALRFWHHGSTLREKLALSRKRAGPKLLAIPEPDYAKLEPVVAEQLKALRETFTGTFDNPTAGSDEIAEACGTLGQLYHAYELNAAAKICYVNAQRLAPADYRWPHLQGVLYEESGELDLAAEYLLKAFQLRPSQEASVVRLGNVLLQLGRTSDASEQFVIALKVNATSVAAVNGMGEVALAEKEYDKAIKYFEQVLEKVPAANRVHYSLAMAYRGLGQIEKAKEHLAQHGTVGLRPIDPLVDGLSQLVEGERLYLIRGRLAFNAGRYREAAEAFGKAVEAKPDSVRARVNLGSALAQAGQIDEAMEQYKKTLELDSSNFAANFNYGFLLLKQDKPEEALEFLKAAVALRNQDLQATRQLAKALYQTDKLQESLKVWQRVLQLSPHHEPSVLELSEMMVDQKRYRDAYGLLDKANQAYPDRGLTALALAKLLATCPDATFRDGKRAVTLAGSIFNTHKTLEHGQALAEALAESDRCEDATILLRKLIEEAEELEVSREQIEKSKEDLLRYETGSPCRTPTETVDDQGDRE